MEAVLIKRMTATACALVVALFVMAGCTSAQPNEQQEQQDANRSYMSEVNQCMESVGTRLSGFTDAVSRGDVVAMRTQADAAFAELDKLNEIDAPDALDDVQQSYVDGTAKLKEALSAYVDLYTEVDSAGDDFDWSSYDTRLADIKAKYDEGIALLQDGDSAAAGKE